MRKSVSPAVAVVAIVILVVVVVVLFVKVFKKPPVTTGAITIRQGQRMKQMRKSGKFKKAGVAGRGGMQQPGTMGGGQ